MRTETYDETKWKLVPISPTKEMKAAGAQVGDQGQDFAHHTWVTMLERTPEFQTQDLDER